MRHIRTAVWIVVLTVASTSAARAQTSDIPPPAFDVGAGKVVTMGSQIAFRTQTRGTFKLLFNAIFHGPAEPVGPAELARLD